VNNIPLSVLDLAPILQGGTAADSFRNSLELARCAERCGYHRFWLAEHHNIPSVASSATAVLIGYIAGGTDRIRVGAGGVMLPNHAPLVIAEQFGTLESLYPGRIDLGLGRAPGGDQLTAYALRRNLGSNGDSFPDDLAELRDYFAGRSPVRAIPGAGLDVPIWLLGSSDFSVRLAAQLGLPFAFASHFAPGFLRGALRIYRENFQSNAGSQPNFMVAVNVCAADTDAQARRLFTTMQQAILALIRRRSGPLQPPVDSLEGLWSPGERQAVESMLAYSVVGSPETVRAGLARLVEETRADELIITAQQFDPAARLRTVEIVSDVWQSSLRA
jgi:luciferase family oxidoreductase group 1